VSEARVTRLSTEEAKGIAEQVKVAPSMAELNVFRVLLRNPPLAKLINDQLIGLLFRGKLDARLRELVILRIGWVTGSEYEWTQHWNVAVGLGLDEPDLVAVRDWRNAARFGPAERAVLASTDETLETGTISAETWAACEAHVGGAEELLELVVAIGNWRLLSSLLRSLEIPLEEGTMAWPPDGVSPR
jgi:alkylhydroperoxidase family enzyme